jgi:hypothetical protein
MATRAPKWPACTHARTYSTLRLLFADLDSPVSRELCRVASGKKPTCSARSKWRGLTGTFKVLRVGKKQERIERQKALRHSN